MSDDSFKVRKLRPADCIFWLKKDDWDPANASILLAGYEPEEFPDGSIDSSTLAENVDGIHRLIIEDINSKKIPVKNSPAAWIAWFKQTGLPLPSELMAVTPAAPVVADGVSGTPAPVADWRNAVRAEAWEQWVKIIAENGTPTLENVANHLAYWCVTNKINGNLGKHPKAGYLKTHVIGGKHWAPPRNMSREAAKKHLEQKIQEKQAN